MKKATEAQQPQIDYIHFAVHTVTAIKLSSAEFDSFVNKCLVSYTGLKKLTCQKSFLSIGLNLEYTSSEGGFVNWLKQSIKKCLIKT